MKRISSITLGVLLSALVAGDASAQWNVARFDTDRNTVYTTFGLNPAWVTTMGYGRVVPVFGHDFQIAGEVGVVAAGVDARDFRVRLETHTSLVRWRSMNVTGSATFITRGTENSVYRGLNFGADLTGTVGAYRPGWFTAAEFGFDKAVITHVTHSDWYRETYYPNAKDGWYLDAGGTYHYGLTGGVSIGRTELAGRFGWQKTEEFRDLTPPVYASLGLGFRF
ncbi:MAG TPA: hypothetical protein VK864_06790 [Longimicrobiales bacterium]|nr:hypothetical protein [Longimicrobiales bacterium]